MRDSPGQRTPVTIDNSMPNESSHVTARAATTMVLAVLCMAGLDALSKHLVQRYPATFVVGVRYAMQTLIVIALLAPRIGRTLVTTHSLGLQMLRGVLAVVASLTIVLAFRNMPLADATALNYTAPSIVTILAFFFLGEKFTRPRIVSLVGGMLGVLLIVRPGSTLFQAAAVLPLITALVSATYQVLTRKLAGENAWAMLFYISAPGAVVTALLFPWFGLVPTLSWTDALAIGAIGVFATTGHFLFIRAVQMAPISGVASITYAQVVFATVVGFIVFGDFPDGWALAGILVIVATGLFLAWSERRRAAVLSEPAVD